MTPKLHACLTLVKDKLQERRQTIVFSALREPLDAVAERLREAGVPFGQMDGRISPQKRGIVSRRFKAKEIPIVLCGIESCAEGHSWPQAGTIILLCYSWSLDKNLQCVDRVWRLDSQMDVEIYSLITEGSIDERLEAMLHEKRDAADLILDGCLLGEESKEVNLAQLLKNAEEDFLLAQGVIDEGDLEKEWPSLRAQLGKAMLSWQKPKTGLVSTELPLWRSALRRLAA